MFIAELEFSELFLVLRGSMTLHALNRAWCRLGRGRVVVILRVETDIRNLPTHINVLHACNEVTCGCFMILLSPCGC